MSTFEPAEWQRCIRWSIVHLCRHGDTDIFPLPIEFRFLESAADEVAERLSSLDLGSLQPINLLESLAPKGKVSFRLAHQMFPVDAVIFTAAVAMIGGKIELVRRPEEEHTAFSYRFKPTEDGKFFSDIRTYHHWLRHQMGFAFKPPIYEFVVETDISDFYQRIYHHRLENALQDCAGNTGLTRLIKRFVGVWRAKQSFGLPVGGSAARLLAELVLNDTDNALLSEGYEYTRYVDDFVILIKRGQDPYDALTFIAEHLAMTEGLSLGASKTRIRPIQEYGNELSIESGEDDQQAERSATERLFWSAYDADGSDDPALYELASHDLAKELREELEADVWNVGKVRILLRAIKLTRNDDAFKFVLDNLELIIPFARELVALLAEYRGVGGNLDHDISRRIVDAILQRSIRKLHVVQAWLLEVFVRGICDLPRDQLNRLDGIKSTLCRRQIMLLRGRIDDKAYFRRYKTRIDEFNPWLQSTFIIGASCLPEDEYFTWLRATGPRLSWRLAESYCRWAASGARACLTPEARPEDQ